jgi:hypothetical protein
LRERHALHDGIRKGVTCRFIHRHFVVWAVRFRENLGEQRDAGRIPRIATALEAGFADRPDLPQHERGVAIDGRPPDDESRRFIALAALGRVDPEVGKEAIFCRDTRQHARGIPFAARHPQHLVCRIREDAGMARGYHAHGDAFTHFRNDTIDHVAIGRQAMLSRCIETHQRFGAGIAAQEPMPRERIA